jgi:predicted O-methyltransferase YrrM
MDNFKFTNNWFNDTAKSQWDVIIPNVKPKKILEIGSYEGASTCYLIQKLAQENSIEIHCIDAWSNDMGEETDYKLYGPNINMSEVESRFKQNTKLAIEKSAKKVDFFIHKGFSDDLLVKLLSSGKKNYFDFIYIDGSHLGPDVLCDAVLSFRLLKINGIMAFDDYLWPSANKSLTRIPKLAIDSFVNLYSEKLTIYNAPLYQIYIQKISD